MIDAEKEPDSSKSVKTANFRLPHGISFSALGLARDTDGQLTLSRDVLEIVCSANELTLEQLSEDELAAFIAAWYFQHRTNGGEPDSVAEQFISEYTDDKQRQSSNHGVICGNSMFHLH